MKRSVCGSLQNKLSHVRFDPRCCLVHRDFGHRLVEGRSHSLDEFWTVARHYDPTEGIAGIKMPKTKGHHTWTDEEIAQYRAYWPLGTQQRLVMEFALETASRRGEVVRFGPQHIRNGRIRIERTHGSEDVDMPMSPELQAACDAMPKVHLTYIITAHGKPRSKYGLGNDFAKWATEAGLPARCRLHGLKKGGMRRLAEAGGTAHELMAFS